MRDDKTLAETISSILKRFKLSNADVILTCFVQTGLILGLLGIGLSLGDIFNNYAIDNYQPSICYPISAPMVYSNGIFTFATLYVNALGNYSYSNITLRYPSLSIFDLKSKGQIYSWIEHMQSQPQFRCLIDTSSQDVIFERPSIFIPFVLIPICGFIILIYLIYMLYSLLYIFSIVHKIRKKIYGDNIIRRIH